MCWWSAARARLSRWRLQSGRVGEGEGKDRIYAVYIWLDHWAGLGRLVVGLYMCVWPTEIIFRFLYCGSAFLFRFFFHLKLCRCLDAAR